MTGNRIRPTVTAVLLVVVLVVAVAGCGGGSSSSAPSVVSNESNESTTTTSRASSSTTASGGTSSGSDLSDALGGTGTCVELGLAYASISLSLLGGSFGAAVGADQSQLDEATKQFDEIQADVPAELKDDFATLRTGFESFSSALSGGTGNFLDPAYQQQLEEAGKALETPEFTAAQKNIENYLDANCPN